MQTSTFQVVMRNAATGGKVRRVFGVTFQTRDDARAAAARMNEREGRAGRNVCWGVREVQS